MPSVKYHSNFLPVVPIHLDQCNVNLSIQLMISNTDARMLFYHRICWLPLVQKQRPLQWDTVDRQSCLGKTRKKGNLTDVY